MNLVEILEGGHVAHFAAAWPFHRAIVQASQRRAKGEQQGRKGIGLQHGNACLLTPIFVHVAHHLRERESLSLAAQNVEK
jgi:hypothetical protein